LKKRIHSNNHRRKKTVAQQKAAYARCVAAMTPFAIPEPRFTDPNGRRWIDEVEYLKHVEESAWLAAKFGPKDEYSEGELEEMFNDPQLQATLDKVEARRDLEPATLH
jgi:hypothetical protein